MPEKLVISRAEWNRICRGKTCSVEFGTSKENSTVCPIFHSCTKKIRVPKGFLKSLNCENPSKKETP